MDKVALPIDHENSAFRKFAGILRARQKYSDADRDIREWVLAHRWQKVGFGIGRDVLTDKFAANLPSLFPNYVPVDSGEISRCDCYFMHGTVQADPKTSHKGATRLLEAIPSDVDLCLMETGFLATTHSWSHSAKKSDPRYACLGYVYDDISHFFMADYPNRLIQKLNSDDALTENEHAKARMLIDRIVRRKITKYNAQSMQSPEIGKGYARRVLVCDQAYQDASTYYGKVDDASFEGMLQAAIDENPDAEILVKTHPDSTWKNGERTGYYSHLEAEGRVRLLRDPVNPFVIFDLVDKVYVGTSQMGLEALFAGKKVVCFGVPFYSGWGLTDDRQPVPHRHRPRSLVDIFHYFYIWYTIYHVPGCPVPSTVEDALDHIEAYRPFRAPFGPEVANATPRVSVIIPVHGVEKYIEECISSVQRQTLLEIEIIPVNDCSPDGSQQIIDRLAESDARIRPIVLEKNIGQGFARNRALEEARGEYIWFLDGDDWLVDPRFLAEVVEAADKNDADMTRAKKAGEAVFDDDGTTLLRIDQDRTEAVFTRAVANTTFADNQDILHSRHFCLWLYRRDFLAKNDIKFLTAQWEERAFLLRGLLHARAITLTTSTSFMYRIRRDSTARRTKSLSDCDNFLSNFEQVAEILVEHNAHLRESALRPHLNFQVSQFLNYLFYGFFYRTVRSEAADAAPYLERIAAVLEKVDFNSRDFTDAPIGIHGDLYEAGVYHLLVAALVACRFDFVATAIDAKPISQEVYLQAQFTIPTTKSDQDFQYALNRYARNERVVSASAKTAQGLAGAGKPRLIIHIGSTKAGSTAIQSFFEANRPAMLQQGIYYPEVGLFWQARRPHKQAGHADFAPEAIGGGTKLKDHVKAAIELSSGKIKTVILSSEAYFLNRNAAQLANQFPEFQIEVVAYLRRQDEWLNSQYAEFVAGGAVGRVCVPIEQWLKEPRTVERMDYLGILKRWERAVGRAHVHVGIYEKATLKDGDIIADFLEMVGLDTLSDLPRPSRLSSNHFPYGNGHVELMRHFNRAPWKSQAEYFAFVDEVDKGISRIRANNGLPKPALNLLGIEARRAIMNRVAASNALIANDFLGRKNEQLFSADTQEKPPVETLLLDEEIRFMMAAFERRHDKNTASNGSNRFQLRKGQAVRSSVIFRAYEKLTSSRLSESKAQKLERDPERFFRDSSSIFLGVVFWLIRAEIAVTFAEQTIESAKLRDTFVYRFVLRFGLKLGRHKLKKLDRDPAAFFMDIRGFGARLLRWVLKLELRLRG